ncbi:hypothetical protein LR48_Vigan09g099500 [Vigna angularis]|uniref:Uncharacterized protein n=1 Tax=Phaseolus angularis TaxID=3914 RepID=A0A0L9VB90_PHAAN|nr:hypothetical protein LR48_Vigan09g099500 [Vigna angularis]
MSSSFLEESDRSPRLSSPVHNEGQSLKPNSPTYVDKRIIFRIPIHLLKGGIPVDDAPLDPVGNVTAIPRYHVFINALPRRLSACGLVECLRHEDCERMAFGMISCMLLLPANPTSWLRGKKSVLAPRAAGNRLPRPLSVRPSSNAHLLPIGYLLFLRSAPRLLQLLMLWFLQASLLGKQSPPEHPVVFLDPSSKAATSSIQPLVKKRKGHKEGERSTSKKGRKENEGSSSRSASKKGRKGKEGSSFRPLPNGYLREYADHRGAKDVRAELLSEKKIYDDLRAANEEVLLAQDESDKKNDELQVELDEAKEKLAGTINRLRDARANYDWLVEECGQLKVVVARQKIMESGLIQKNRALADDLTKAKEKISKLEAGIVFEHEEGFNQALRQASVLMGFKEPFALGFDIEKDVFDGVLVPLESSATEETQMDLENPPNVEALDKEVEVEDVEDEEAGDAEGVNAAVDDDGHGAE